MPHPVVSDTTERYKECHFERKSLISLRFQTGDFQGRNRCLLEGRWSDVSREGGRERATLTKCGLVPELRLDRRDSPSQWQRGAGTNDQRIEERERERRGQKGLAAPRPVLRRRRQSQGGREGVGHGPTTAHGRGPVACCGGREALLHCNKTSGGHVTRGSTAERERDREVLNDLHLRQNKAPDRKKRREA